MKHTLTLLGLTLLLASCTRSEAGRLPSSASSVALAHAQACDAGDAVACYALALIYQLGEESYQGVTADTERAAELFARACAEAQIEEARAATE